MWSAAIFAVVLRGENNRLEAGATGAPNIEFRISSFGLIATAIPPLAGLACSLQRGTVEYRAARPYLEAFLI